MNKEKRENGMYFREVWCGFGVDKPLEKQFHPSLENKCSNV